MPFANFAENSDFNNATATGIYSIMGSNSPNGIKTAWFAVYVVRIASNINYVTQIALGTGANLGLWIRAMDNGTWSSWTKL